MDKVSASKREEPISTYNFESAIQCVKAFSASTGIGCTISDLYSNVIFQTGHNCSSCRICTLLSENEKLKENCWQSHLYGLLQAEKFGGSYIYFCPIGLTCFVSPILYDGQSEALVTAGPVLMVDPEDFVNYDLKERLGISGHKLELVMNEISQFLQLGPEKVNQVARLLFMSIGFVNNIAEYNRLLSAEKSAQIQGQIVPLLQSLKVDESGEAYSYPFDKEKELANAIVQSDKENAQRLLNELLGHIFFYCGADFGAIKSRVLELMILLSRAAIDGGADSQIIFGLNQRYVKEINYLQTIDELCYWLTNVMNRFMDFVFRFDDVKHRDIIQKAIGYIRQNFSKKITLEEVASYVFLSPSYFSKIFKEEMNCNFNVFLNRVRIDQSKKLLLGNIKMVDIAGLVGFEDQSYFSKVFRKVTGMTPRAFRETGGISKTAAAPHRNS